MLLHIALHTYMYTRDMQHVSFARRLVVWCGATDSWRVFASLDTSAAIVAQEAVLDICGENRIAFIRLLWIANMMYVYTSGETSRTVVHK